MKESTDLLKDSNFLNMNQRGLCSKSSVVAFWRQEYRENELVLWIKFNMNKLKKREPEERKEPNNIFWDKDHLLRFRADSVTNDSSQTSEGRVMKNGNINNVDEET